LTVRGSIWLLDEMFAQHIIKGENAILALDLMRKMSARFPQAIFRQKVNEWSKSGNK
jgi:hypothetical protein